MEASVNVDSSGTVAIVEGGTRLTGCPVRATDLRGGAAMVIAALMADGLTEIYDLKYIDRGYEKFERKAQRSRRADYAQTGKPHARIP